MNIIEHGKWQIYTAPDELLERRNLTRQHGVVFSKRVDTGEDWYDYSLARFAAKTTVLITMIEQPPDGLVTGAANTNYNFIFPANGELIEVTDYSGSDPQADFGNKIYDPEEQTFTDRPPMQPQADPEVAELKKAVEGMRKLLAKLAAKQ